MEKSEIRQKENENEESTEMENEGKERGKEKKSEAGYFRRAARPFSQEHPLNNKGSPQKAQILHFLRVLNFMFKLPKHETNE